MNFHRLVAFITGYVAILVRGPQMEKFINLVSGSGMRLWDIRRLGPEVIQAKVRVPDFLAGRVLFRRSGTHVKVLNKQGWPFIGRRMARRQFLWGGAIVCLALLVYLSSFILVIKVEGFKGEDREHLLTTLRRSGLRPGIPRRVFFQRKSYIEQEVMLETPHAVWLGINVHGVVAEVKVVARKEPPRPGEKRDIIASEEGVITRMIVIRGLPAVKEGDTVAKGDLLISGTEWHTDPEEEGLILEQVQACGKVEARVWYEWEIIEPKVSWRPFLDKECYSRYKLRWGRKLWSLSPADPRLKGSFSYNRLYKRIYCGRNPLDNVELIKDTWQKVAWRRVKRPLSQVKASAVQEMNRKRRWVNANIKGSPRAIWTDEGNFLRLSVTVEVTQDITLEMRRGKEH